MGLKEKIQEELEKQLKETFEKQESKKNRKDKGQDESENVIFNDIVKSTEKFMDGHKEDRAAIVLAVNVEDGNTCTFVNGQRINVEALFSCFVDKGIGAKLLSSSIQYKQMYNLLHEGKPKDEMKSELASLILLGALLK